MKENNVRNYHANNYMAVKEAEEQWNIGSRMFALYCVAGRIKGAEITGNMWRVLKDAKV